MGYVPLRRGAGRLFDENLNRMLQELFDGVGSVSEGNSSTVALTGGATFTGAWEMTTAPDVMASLKTDASGTLFFDFSTDGVNSDSTFPPLGFTVAAGVNEFHTAVKGPRYFRVRLVNGASAQTYLRMGVYYGTFRQGNLPVNAGIGSDADATIVRVIPTDVDLALGRIGGKDVGIKFGRNPGISTTTDPADVWNGNGNYTGQPVGFTPETVHVFSASANDTSAGTGARTIRITGLKTSTSTEYETEDLTLNGTTAVTSANTWWRVNRAEILTAGSGGENAGEVTVRPTTTTANVFVVMPAGYNRSQIGAFTVPAGHNMILKRLRVAITRANGSAGSATVTLRVREPGGVYQARRAFEIQTGAPTEFTNVAGDVFPAGSDIKVRVEQVSDNNTIVDTALEYILVDQI